MAGVNRKAPTLEADYQRHAGAPLPVAQALSLSTPVKPDPKRRQYNSAEELSMTETTTAAVAAATDSVSAIMSTPPITFAPASQLLPSAAAAQDRRVAIRGVSGTTYAPVDPFHPPPPLRSRSGSEEEHRSLAALTQQQLQRQQQKGGNECDEGKGAKQQQQENGSLTTASQEVRHALREAGGQDDDNSNGTDSNINKNNSKNNSKGNADAAAPGIFNAENQPKEFQCPHLPQMVLVLLVFTALVQGFSSTAISLFINIVLRLQPVEVVQYWMYIGFTAWIQPAIGYLSDALVLFGEKRRPLFVLAAVGNTIIFFIYAAVPGATSNHKNFVLLSLVSQLFTMGLYIPLNGLVVEVGRHDAETEEESMARMSAIMSKTMVWRSIGSLVGNILQTLLVLRVSVSSLLGISSLLFLILVPIVLVTPRRLFLRTGSQDQNFYKRVAEAGRLLWRSFDIHDLRSDGFCFVIVLAFVFVYTMMPDAGSVYYNYLYNAFAFPTWFYALNNCIGYLGSIAGAYVFSLWMDHRARQEASGGTRTSMFFIFMIGSFAWAFGYVTNLLLCTGFVTQTLGIPAGVYVPVDNFFMSLFVRFAFMPTLTMAAEHAPKFFEATTFEVFSVASIGGGTISSSLTSVIAKNLGITITDYGKLWVLIVISIVLKLVPIPLAYFLPERHNSSTDGVQPTVEGDDGMVGREGGGEEREEVGDEKHEDATGKLTGAEVRAEGVAESTADTTQSGSGLNGAAGPRLPHTQLESSRVSQSSDDMYDPSMPLTRSHRSLA